MAAVGHKTLSAPDEKTGHTKAIKDSHGNAAFVHESTGTGPDYAKEKHTHPTRSYNTGQKDAAGIEIWATRSEKE
jgi:hypothetical protein